MRRVPRVQRLLKKFVSLAEKNAITARAISEISTVQPTADPESNSRKDLERDKQTLGSLVGAMRATASFTSALRQRTQTVECLVFSFYGYASLRMFEARSGVCFNKVRCPVGSDCNGN